MRTRSVLLFAATLLAAANAADAPALREDPRAVAAQLAGMLESNYVFPGIAKRYAAQLRSKAAAGAYDGLTDASGLAQRLTADIQAVSPDGHLKVRLREGAAAGPPKTHPPAIAAAEWIKPGIAYLKFRAFTPAPDQSAAVKDFLVSHQGAKALIIDARECRGGILHVPDQIFSMIYDRPQTLLVMDTRRSVADAAGASMDDGENLVHTLSDADIYRQEHRVVPSPAAGAWPKTPVYLLTAPRTFSACEHVALALKRTHRATLIGETTGGGGHFGGGEDLGAHLSVFVPIGRTYDPDTGWDWEGRGVAPDVAVPAADALDKALSLIP